MCEFSGNVWSITVETDCVRTEGLECVEDIVFRFLLVISIKKVDEIWGWFTIYGTSVLFSNPTRTPTLYTTELLTDQNSVSVSCISLKIKKRERVNKERKGKCCFFKSSCNHERLISILFFCVWYLKYEPSRMNIEVFYCIIIFLYGYASCKILFYVCIFIYFYTQKNFIGIIKKFCPYSLYIL